MKNNFESLIDKNKYQVFLFASSAAVPINFAKHGWFVLNKRGEISRWEVFHFKNKSDMDHKFLHHNTFLPFEGFSIFYPLRKFSWQPKILGYVEGGENSGVMKIIQFIENSRQNYPFCNKYNFFGPNSNTYVQNVLNKFPEFNVKLSPRFIGKDYR